MSIRTDVLQRHFAAFAAAILLAGVTISSAASVMPVA